MLRIIELRMPHYGQIYTRKVYTSALKYLPYRLSPTQNPQLAFWVWRGAISGPKSSNFARLDFFFSHRLLLLSFFDLYYTRYVHHVSTIVSPAATPDITHPLGVCIDASVYAPGSFGKTSPVWILTSATTP